MTATVTPIAPYRRRRDKKLRQAAELLRLQAEAAMWLAKVGEQR